VSAAQRHLAAIAAAPRPAGGDAERRARDYCAAVLRAAGCTVAERPFEYSTLPGKWGTPLAGACLVVLFAAAGHLGFRAHTLAALLVLAFGAALLSGLAFWLGAQGVLDIPFARASGINLEAARGRPTLWLVAHLDSKSQPVPIVVRAVGIIGSIAMWVLAAMLALAQLLGAHAYVLWVPVTLLGVLAALPVMASTVGARSPGALDDASGVVTVLRTIELLPRELSIGVLLTSAEELGLAGARAWARTAAPARAVNVDGVDDHGEVRLIYTGHVPLALVAVLGQGGDAWPAPKRLPPGALMDGVELADAGFQVLNVSKGSLRTVSRIHTPRDDLARLDGRGAEEVAGMLARAIASEPAATF